MPGVQQVSFNSPYSDEEAEILRQQRMAELLRAQSMQPMGGTDMAAGGVAIRRSPFEGLAKMANAANANSADTRAREMARALRERQQGDVSADMGTLSTMLRGSPASSEQVVDEQANDGMGAAATINAPARAGGFDPGMMAQLRSPFGQNFAMQQFAQQMAPKKPVVVGRSLLNPDTGAMVGQDATWQAEQEAARAQREGEQGDRRTETQRAEAARIAEGQRAEQARFDQQRQMAQIVAGNRQPNQPQIIQTAQGPMVMGPNNTLAPLKDEQGNQVKPPAGRGGQMTATAQKELIETEEAMQGGQAALGLFNQAKALNDKAMGFTGAGALASAGTLLPDEMRPGTVDATQNLDNILQTAALPQLKAIFGGMPTEGERKILLDVQGSSSKPSNVRAEIFKRAEEAIQARIKFAGEKAKRLREGTYFSGEGLPSLQPDGGGLSAQDTAAREWANANPNDPRAAAIKQRLGAK